MWLEGAGIRVELLSILYLRCTYIAVRINATQHYTFNSLFEMHDIELSAEESVRIMSFNSLFEMLVAIAITAKTAIIVSFQFSI